ncbi:MAG: hydantoinase/oxoprolinase family protein [Candidatus Hydrothermarchaeaceae archaeon]
MLNVDSGGTTSEIHNFPLWKKKGEFAAFLQGLKEDADMVGITMTAELSDVFSSREEGINYIVSVCEDVFEAPVYLTLDETLLKAGDIPNPLDIAAANWVASIHFLKKKFSEGILIDCGSTTTDIIPFSASQKYPRRDIDRIKSEQLVYTGILRTPVNTIVDAIPFGGEMVHISSEYFAITADVYTILGLIPSGAYSCDTPDGRGKSRSESMQRISRLLCADFEEVGTEAVMDICRYVKERQVEKIASAIKKHDKKDAYICGAGKILAEEACASAGLKAMDLSMITPAHDNLPCHGLAHMILGDDRFCKINTEEKVLIK